MTEASLGPTAVHSLYTEKFTLDLDPHCSVAVCTVIHACLQGEKGDKGDRGETGIAGRAGKPGLNVIINTIIAYCLTP